MMKKKFNYFVINKPFGVLTQFSDKQGRKTLKDCYKFPYDVYPIGRLDMDSEGLLILSNDKSLTNILLNPQNKVEKEYWVQVEGLPDETAIKFLSKGVELKERKTLPAKVEIMAPPEVWDRIPPIRDRKNIPTSWLKIIISEGMNRQVRRMTAAAGYPTLRLIRYRIKNICLDKLQPGEFRILDLSELKHLTEKAVHY